MNPTNIIKLEIPNKYLREYGDQTTGVKSNMICTTL